jgi:hypothetical protein
MLMIFLAILLMSLCFCVNCLFLFYLESSLTFFGLLFVFDFAIETKVLTCELIARFSTSHLMDAMGICYPQYWLQGDVEDNFNRRLMLIKAHCCFKKLLEPVKTSKVSSSLVVSKICPIIMSTSALDL